MIIGNLVGNLIELDATLTQSGKAADAKAVADYVTENLSSGSNTITISSTDLEAGVSPLADGEVYLVYE